jgi:hypothetical protein
VPPPPPPPPPAPPAPPARPPTEEQATGADEGERNIQDTAERIASRVRAYLGQQREAAAAKLRRALDDKILGYDAVLAVKRRILEVPHLLGGDAAAAAPDMGSLLFNGDGRTLDVIMDVSIGQNKVVTASVDSYWRCLCMAEHSGEVMAGRGGGDGRAAIILADQAYPPYWRANGARKCLVVIRMEHGTLFDLAEELLERLQGRFLEAGSVVMLASSTHLAMAGTAAYCEDMMAAIRILKRNLGEHVIYTPLPVYFGNGCSDGLSIRAAVEVAAWATHVFGRERVFLKRTFEASHVIIQETGEGGRQVPTAARYRLPARADGNGGTAMWVTDGLVRLPRRVRAPSAAQEKDFYAALANELRAGLALNVELEPSFDRAVREGATAAAMGDGGYLVIGGDNAKLLQKALQQSGKAATLIHLANFRIIRGAGEAVAAKIKEAIVQKRPAAIVFEILDDTVYEVLTEEGDKLPPRRIDGVMHMEGDIKLCEKAVLLKILKMCRPILEATDGISTVFIGPMPRYVTAACCSNAAHMPNRRQLNFLEELKRDLAGANMVIKEFLYNEDFNNVRAMDPWVGLRHIASDTLWGEDPVHVKEEHVQQLVKGVDLALSKIKPKRRRDSNNNSMQKRGRMADGDRRGWGGGGGGGRGGGGSGGGGATGRGGGGSGGGRGGGGSFGGGGSGGSRPGSSGWRRGSYGGY